MTFARRWCSSTIPRATTSSTPTSHDRTVSLAVSPADSSLVAVTGWASVLDNEGDERVFLSTDAGARVERRGRQPRGRHRHRRQARGRRRVLVPTGNGRETALVVGAANGAYATVVQGADGARRATASGRGSLRLARRCRS